MRSRHPRRFLLLGIVALGLVAAACGKSASASENPTTSPTPSPAISPTPSPSYGMPGSNTKTVIEGPGNSFAFMPSTINVKQGTTLMLNNVSDTAHTFTVTGQGIDVETQPGETSQVTIDLKPGSYPFICRFHQSLGMTGTLVVT
jgi:plastocyanin